MLLLGQTTRLTRHSIRSFDNNIANTIKFFTPLTLIVGQNGCGKTTIIECLKYATTGELPPNSKGGAFIHDPKLCKENPVRAQVKLQIRPASEEKTEARMVVTRSLELLSRKATRSQKTLEGHLLLLKNGEKTDVSKRNAELDQMIPQCMGTSAAILDNVIFCHQDEAMWPLSEPSVLKKRFDEIFEAQKYTKAVDNIKVVKKKHAEELGKFKIIEQHTKEDKTKADKNEKKSWELNDEIKALREEIKSLNDQAKEAADKAQEAWNHVATFASVVETLKTSRRNREWHQKQLANLKANLTERHGSDDALQSELDQYEDRIKQHEARQEQQRHRYNDIDEGIARVRDRQSDKRTQLGKHEQEEATHEKRVAHREQEVKRSAREHGLRGYDTDLDDMQISEFMERITKLSKDQDSRIERLRKENAGEVQKIQDVLDDLREQRTSLRESQKGAKEQIALNDRRSATYRGDLERVTIDEAGIATLEGNIEELESRLRDAKQQMSRSDSSSKAAEITKNLQMLESEADALNRELIQSTKRAGDLAQLEHLKKESKARQRSIQTMKGAHGERLAAVVGESWLPESVEQAFQKVLDAKKEEVTEAERQRDGVSRELDQFEFRLRTARKDLASKEEELARCAAQVREVVPGEPDEYPEVLAEAQADRDTRRADVDNFRNMRKYFAECIETAQSAQPACRLCRRGFEDAKAVRGFVARLEKQVSKAALEGMQAELAELEAELQKVQAAGAGHATWVRLAEREAPPLRAAIAQLEQQRDGLVRDVEAHDRRVAERAEARRDAETLAKPVATIAKCHAEHEDFEGRVRELAAKLPTTAPGGARTLDEVQALIEAHAARMRERRGQLEKLQADDRQQTEEVGALGLERAGAKSKLMNARHELEKRGAIEKQIGELKASNQQQREAVANLDAQLQELDPRLSEQQTKLEDTRQRGDARESELQKGATNLKGTVRALMQADEDIRSYIQGGGLGKLEQCRRDIQTLADEIQAMEAEKRQVTVELNKINTELGNQGETKRVLQDNLNYRKQQRELRAIEAEIAELAAHNAEQDQEQHRQEAEGWQRRHNLAATEQTSKMSTAKALDDQLKQLLADWNSDFKDAAAKYRRARIDVATTAAAVEDLERYAKALDQAIMRYHGLKMEEINRQLAELWQNTYRGSDVDAICIRSEPEGPARGAQRSHSYRVVMLKAGAEMDMRGRCSAGQKVLASILIRLALAEGFGRDCGLIALDEPTTNLDRDNVRSLAASLHGLIRSRRGQKNFQLVVITHDEGFLREMRCQDFCDHYWRVSRNDQQKSQIERQSVASVMEVQS